MVRRILPAIVVVGLLAAGTTWFASQLAQQPTERAVEPRLHDAVASLRLRPKSAAGAGTADYEKFRQAEMQLIASPEILRAALDRPGIAELDTLGDVEDKVAWLTNHIAVVAVPESEVVEIRLRGDDPREAALIVDAVATAYADTANKLWKAERDQRRDALERNYDKYMGMMAEFRSRYAAFTNRYRSLGPTVEVAAQFDDMRTLHTVLTLQQQAVAAIDKELQRIEDAGPREPRGDGEAADDPVEAVFVRKLQMIREWRAKFDEKIASETARSSQGADDRAVKLLQRQRDDLQRWIDELNAAPSLRVVAEPAVDPARRPGTVDSSPAMLRKRRERLAQQLEETLKEFDKVKKEVGDAYAELTVEGNEIAELQGLASELYMSNLACPVYEEGPVPVEIIKRARSTDSSERATGGAERSDDHSR